MADDDPGRPRGPAPTFEVAHETEPSGTLVAGFSQFGLAGVTAVNYLVDHLDMETTGHVSVEALPAITPFEQGTPRHHTRFFSRPDLDVTVLAGELFVPVVAADPFSRAIVDWIATNEMREVAVLSGVPIAHGPEAHRVFYVATEDYQRRRLADTEVPPMGRGFLDGVPARLLERGIDSPLAAGVFVTPVHARTPDVEAAIRLVETARDVYGLPVDTGELESLAEDVQNYYADLAERLEAVEREQRPEDRMYM